MRLHRPSALLLGATLVFGAVATPSLAFADDTPAATATTTPTTLTTVQLAQALQGVETSTAKEGKDGWSEKVKDTEGGSTSNLQLTYAVLQGRDYVGITGDPKGPAMKEIDVQDKGSYQNAASVAQLFFGSAAYFKRLAAAVGRPNATWVYMADPKTDLSDPETGIADASPAAAVGSLVDTQQTIVSDPPAPTVSTQANGDTVYTFSGITTDDEGNLAQGTFTATVNPDNALISLDENLSDEVVTATFSYGAQHIALPKASQIVSLSRLLDGVPLVTMKSDARMIAALTRVEVAKKKHKASATKHLIRTNAKKWVKAVNESDGAHIFSLRNTAAGVMLTGRNRFTHHTVVYTVKAAGKKAIVHHL